MQAGVTINTFIVVLRALFLLPESRVKSFTARCSAVKCFFIAHLFAYQMGTYTLQHMPAKVESNALNSMPFMCHIVFGANSDRRFVINMDQTPVYFNMNAKLTLELVEKKNNPHLHVDGQAKWVTVAVTICTNGTLLLLVLIYKGQPNDRIVKKEFPSGVYPPNHFYHCQPAA